MNDSGKAFKLRLRTLLLGSASKKGLLQLLCIYGVLGGLGFVFLYPVLYMLSVSFMDVRTLVDSTVTWIPTAPTLENYRKAMVTLDFWPGIADSLKMTVLPALLQTLSLALAGYGLGRFPVPGKKLWVALAVLVFLIPAQVTMIPRYLLFNSYQMIGSIWPVYLISALGQGVKSSVFLLVYYQFFASYPRSLDEAAQLDGAGRLGVFLRISLPMARPAMVVCFLFSFVWIWNDTTQVAQYSTGAASTLPMRLAQFVEAFNRLYSSASVSTGGALNESIRLSGTLLVIAPLLVIYATLQKQFVESLERTGITGE